MTEKSERAALDAEIARAVFAVGLASLAGRSFETFRCVLDLHVHSPVSATVGHLARERGVTPEALVEQAVGRGAVAGAGGLQRVALAGRRGRGLGHPAIIARRVAHGRPHSTTAPASISISSSGRRLEALSAAAERHCGGALRVRETRAGLHAVTDLDGVDARRVFEEAAARGAEVMPLSAYYFGRGEPQNALVLGFGAVRPDGMDAGMRKLAAAIEAARP